MSETKFYTIRQTANILGIKVRTVREWLNSGKLSGKKNVNGRWSIYEESINNALERSGKCSQK